MADLEQLNDWELLLSSDSEIDSSSAPFNPDSDSSSDSLADSTTAEAADFQGKHEEVLQEEEIRGNQEIGVQNQNLLDSGLGVEAEIEDAGVMERVHSSQGGGGGEGMVWWKVPFHIFKFCLLRVNPVWSLSVAAAVLGFVILRKRLNRMKPKTRNIPIKLAVEDKVDLRGGYYDAGDNVKFNFPMAFTTTMLSWSALEYGGRMGSQLGSARVAIRWATDYLLKCATATPGKLYVGVGDPNADHKCWERPEDMDTVRTVYSVSPQNPGSDVAGETAAALAAASMVFRKVDPNYSKVLLRTAKKVMQFALQYRGAYSDSLGSAVCPFYCSYSGYKDELIWGAAWLLRATNDVYYFNTLKSLGGIDGSDIFSWDNKFAGASVLLSRRALLSKDNSFEPYRQQAEEFMCRILPNSPSSSTQYTRGGLMYKLGQSNLQYVTSITFLLSTYAKYMQSAGHSFNCGNVLVTPNTLRMLSKRQVDYILGENPLRMSYMVGFGPDFPRRIHHRGSSLPSVTNHPQSIRCDGGFQPFFYSANPNPNILVGALVGGPDQNDFFRDDRADYSHSEPATYINAALIGPLAYLAGSYRV